MAERSSVEASGNPAPTPRSGTMVVRWVSTAIVEAEKKFRRVHGCQNITKVVSALGHLEAKEGASTERVA